MVEQIVDIDVVHVALDVLEVNLGLLIATCTTVTILILTGCAVVIVIIVFFVLRLVVICLLEPIMRQYLRHSEAGSRLQLDHAAHQCLRLWAQLIRECELALQNELVQVLQVRCLEWHCAAKHGEQQNAERPDVNEESFVTLINDDLWRKVRRGTTLLLNDLTLLDNFGHAEVTDLDALLAVQQNVV